MLRKIWDHFEVVVANLALAVMVGLLTVQIVARYCFQVGIGWTEELSRFSFLYFVYLSSCFVMMKGRHIKVEFLLDLLPAAPRAWVVRLGDTVQIVFCLVASYAGVVLLRGMIAYPVYSPSLMLPLSFFYAVIPLAFFLMAVRIAQRMLQTFSAGR